MTAIDSIGICISMPIDLERISHLHDKMLEHLEAALAIADETQDEDAGHLIERDCNGLRLIQTWRRFARGSGSSAKPPPCRWSGE